MDTIFSNRSNTIFRKSCYLNFSEPGYHTLRLDKATSCGTITTEVIINVQENYRFELMASPNPTTDAVNIIIANESPQVRSLPQNDNMIVELFNFNTSLKAKQWTFKNHQKQFGLNLFGLPAGQYLLSVKKGTYRKTLQIIKQ